MLSKMLPDLARLDTVANVIVAFDVLLTRFEAVELEASLFELLLMGAAGELVAEFVAVVVVEVVVEVAAGSVAEDGAVPAGTSVAAVQVGSQRDGSTFGGQKHLPAMHSPTPPQLSTPHI